MKVYRIEAYDSRKADYQSGDYYQFVYADNKCGAIRQAQAIYKDHACDMVRARNIYKEKWKVVLKSNLVFCRCHPFDI